MWPVAKLSKDHMIGSMAVRYDRMYVHKKALLIVICRKHHMLSQVLSSVTRVSDHSGFTYQFLSKELKSKFHNVCPLP